MSGYQFITIETYARTPSKNKKKQSARGVAKEAERAPESSLHVENPKPPIHVYGAKPGEVVTEAERLAQCSGSINPDTILGGTVTTLEEVFNDQKASIIYS